MWCASPRPTSVQPLIEPLDRGAEVYVICLSAHRSIGALKWLHQQARDGSGGVGHMTRKYCREAASAMPLYCIQGGLECRNVHRMLDTADAAQSTKALATACTTRGDSPHLLLFVCTRRLYYWLTVQVCSSGRPGARCASPCTAAAATAAAAAGSAPGLSSLRHSSAVDFKGQGNFPPPDPLSPPPARRCCLSPPATP